MIKIVIVSINLVVLLVILRIIYINLEADKIRISNVKRSAKPSEVTVGAKQYYQLFKYMYLQATGGARIDQILKTLYKSASDPSLAEELKILAAFVSENGSLEEVKSRLREMKMNTLFTTSVFTMIDNGMDEVVLRDLDHLYFNTYLNDIRKETKKIKRNYLIASILLVIAVSTAVLLPMFAEMMASLSEVFR